MFKSIILIALCISSASALQSSGSSSGDSGEPSGAPEPYAYGYATDTHSASEERDPSGRVQGSYSLVDTDGRQRRVEYYADETGFHAKVQTNELGTKTSNPADAQVLAAPANAEQLAYQPAPQQVAYQPAVVPQAQRLVQLQQQQVAYQPAYGYAGYGGYGQNGYLQSAGYGLNGYGYSYYPGLATNNGGYLINGGYSTIVPQGQLYGSSQNAVYGGYNYHTPSSYYQARGLNGVVPASGLVTSSNVANSPSVSTTNGVVSPAGASSSSSSLTGSSNYVILKKRA